MIGQLLTYNLLFLWLAEYFLHNLLWLASCFLTIICNWQLFSYNLLWLADYFLHNRLWLAGYFFQSSVIGQLFDWPIIPVFCDWPAAFLLLSGIGSYLHTTVCGWPAVWPAHHHRLLPVRLGSLLRLQVHLQTPPRLQTCCPGDEFKSHTQSISILLIWAL